MVASLWPSQNYYSKNEEFIRHIRHEGVLPSRFCRSSSDSPTGMDGIGAAMGSAGAGAIEMIGGGGTCVFHAYSCVCGGGYAGNAVGGTCIIGT